MYANIIETRKNREWNIEYNETRIGSIRYSTSNWSRENKKYVAYYCVSNNRDRDEYIGEFKNLFAAKLAIVNKYFEIFGIPNKNESTDIKYLPIDINSEFYPTPSWLAGKMFSGINWYEIDTLLDPEAGKGDLVKYANKVYENINRGCNGGLDADCIEIDENLQHILNGNGFRVVHNDFLNFKSQKRYDLIAMNPPFSNGELHLLKAIELQKHGGKIVCILNANTIKNPYTNTRKVLIQRLNQYNASIQFLKDEFCKAERKTNVEIALIKINIPREYGESEIFSRLHKAEKQIEEDFEVKDLTTGTYIEKYIKQYEVEVQASLELIREYKAMQPYIMESLDETETYTKAILSLAIGDKVDYKQRIDINQYLRCVRLKYWKALLTNKEFIGKLTSNLQEKYREMVNDMADYDFTMFNIKKIIAEMNCEMLGGVKDTIISLFDKLSEEHSWYPECQKNIHYFNGWKTNKAHKVGMKVILPTYGSFSSYSWSDHTFEVNSVYKDLVDIEKVFNYLDGNMTEDVDLFTVLKLADNKGQTKKIQCKYFEVTLYKKGTTHIKFFDERLIDCFNIYAARNKSWLPPRYGKVAYEDLEQDEREVVDDFQGEEAYKKVYQNQDKYLYEVNESNVLMLTA